MSTNPNIVITTERAFVSSVPSAPANNATAVLFNTHSRKPGGSGTAVPPSTFTRGNGTEVVAIAPDAIKTVRLTYHLHDRASAANGIRVYQTADGGATWQETDMKDTLNAATIGAAAPVQVPVLSAGQEWSEKFEIDGYKGIAIEHIAGATGPTAQTGWLLTIAVFYVPQGGR